MVADSIGILVVVDDLHVTGQATVGVPFVVDASITVDQLEASSRTNLHCAFSSEEHLAITSKDWRSN